MSHPKRIAITGGYGFLGWHTACRLRAIHGIEALRLGRDDFASPQRLETAIADVDAVIHVAGVNRAESDDAVESGNAQIAQQLAAAIRRHDGPLDVVYANSIQCELDNAYGRGKLTSAKILAAAVESTGGRFSDVLLPNLFGEHGRPEYNSFVATFASAVATGGTPAVTRDREVSLLHAQDAAAALISPLLDGTAGTVAPVGEARSVSEVLYSLNAMHRLYECGDVPPLTSKFETDLFNTYRSFRFPASFPHFPELHSDERGTLFETTRSHGGTGQSFVSTTTPGATRGDHYHLHKVERFFVVKGEARIELRRLLYDDVVTFELSGDKPSFVDMPTMWVHSITNIGDSELITMFWADQLRDTDNPDQYPERVRRAEESS